MAEEDRRLGELDVGKDLLDRHGGRLAGLDHLADAGVDREQPFLERFALGFHGAGLDQPHGAAVAFEHAVSGDVEPGVEPNHAFDALGRRRGGATVRRESGGTHGGSLAAPRPDQEAQSRGRWGRLHR